MIVDLHNDVGMKRLAFGVSMHEPGGLLSIDMASIRAVRPTALVFVAYSDPHFAGRDAEALVARQLELLRADFAHPESVVDIAFSAADIGRIAGGGRTAAILGVEGGYAISDSLAPLNRFHAAGVRLMTLTHMQATAWAGADTDGAERGLTPFGEEVVARMNELGMIVDVAHTSTETILAAARVSRAPVVFSHGGARALAGSNRAITDEGIRAIAETGGVVGISFFPLHLIPGSAGADWEAGMEERGRRAAAIAHGDGTIEEKFRGLARLFGDAYPVPDPARIPGMEPLLDTIEHLIRVGGEDIVALGSDYDGIAYTLRGLERFAEIRAIERALARGAASAARIEKLMGGNARRVIEAVLP